jgi:rSAM/selenodomain-associated transferase 2
VRLVDGILATGLIAALYAPYVTRGRLPAGSLGVFADRFRFNQTLFVVTSSLFTGRGAAALAVLGGLAVAAALRSRLPPTSPAAWAWPMASALALSPVVYPWYLVWLVPFAVSAATVPLLAWTVTILSTYSVWHLHEIGRPWEVPAPVLAFEFGTVIAVAIWAAINPSRSRSAAPGQGRPCPPAGGRAGDVRLSVLIPTFEEESALEDTLTHTLRILRGHEVIVVDGGSADRTPEIARRHAKLVTLRKTRGAALNEAAVTARGEVLLFLHADTLLPPDAAAAIEGALADPEVVGGAFRFSFDDQRWGARAIAVWVNARSALLNVFLGDQALFVRRDAFLRAGGFRDWSVMEDLEILGRLRRFGRLRLLSPPVVTSARRHRQRGYVRTLATIWLLTWLNLLGVPGPALARLYRPQR